MTDRDRLIELFKGAESKVMEELNKHLELEEKEWMGIYADYLLANGVIVPPCKVGDKLYDIQEFVLGVSSPEIYELKADEMTIEKGIDGALNFVYDGMYINNEDIGKTIFLTKEEAEAKLKELG